MAPQRILVRAPNWIGDQVMAFPFYRALHALFPQAELHLLGKPAVLALEPPVPFARRLALPSGKLAELRLARSLSKENFDLAITLPASLSSALFLRATRIPRRVGFAEPAARYLLTEVVPWRGRASGKHKAQLYLDLIGLFGGQAGKADFAPPARSPRKAIVLAPGASIALREWPHFAQFTRELHARHPDYRLIVVGGEADRAWESLTSCGAESRIGETTLEEVRALCRDAAVVVATDSGIAHIASALSGAPSVVLFGPGDPAYIRPLGPAVREARAAEVPCSPCESAHCRAPYGYQKCLRDLSVETVLRQVEESLRMPSL